MTGAPDVEEFAALADGEHLIIASINAVYSPLKSPRSTRVLLFYFRWGSRRTRHSEMFQVLLANDVKYWGERFMTTLTRPHAVPTWIVRSSAFLND